MDKVKRLAWRAVAWALDKVDVKQVTVHVDRNRHRKWTFTAGWVDY